ncbi:hypothetical protein ACF061_12615 [Streptomyces sp. NPDC015220]|uniref:hypothetical protein n=1 Tax=Streptomyces sp. NPDC015220 TaxID=3364947 RepID=UPI0036F509D5
MSRTRRISASLAAVAALTAGLLVTATAPAAAGHCPHKAEPKFRGAEGSWTVTCAFGSATIRGWFKDTADDGKCARIRIRPRNDRTWTYFDKVCGKGNSHQISRHYPHEFSVMAELYVR